MEDFLVDPRDCEPHPVSLEFSIPTPVAHDDEDVKIQTVLHSEMFQDTAFNGLRKAVGDAQRDAIVKRLHEHSVSCYVARLAARGVRSLCSIVLLRCWWRRCLSQRAVLHDAPRFRETRMLILSDASSSSCDDGVDSDSEASVVHEDNNDPCNQTVREKNTFV